MRRKPGKSVRTGETLLRVEIPADAVRLGMRVIELDRPWTDVPFLFQQQVMEEDWQLQLLRQYCLGVTVELNQAQYRLANAEKQRLAARGLKSFPVSKTLAEELPTARLRYTEALTFVEELLGRIEAGQTFALDTAQTVIKNCVTSIMANANAMFWLSRIRRQDAYTAEHCLRVGILAISFGRFLDFPQEDLETLGLCGALHDIGKMRIPDSILNKPGSLTPEEMAVMQTHAAHGFELLGSHHRLPPVVRDATLSHHERMDGKGYPNGLSGSSISRFTRIIAIVDAYDAITSDRCYKKGLSPADALRILYQERGSHFDEALVEIFIRMIGLYPPGSLVEMNSGEVGIVLATDPNRKLRPMVELVLDSQGNPCQPRVLNLAENPLTEAGATYAIARSLPDGVPGFKLEDYIERQTGVS